MARILLLSLLIILSIACSAQKKWFSVYDDSVALVKDANQISASFIRDVQLVKPDFAFDVRTILNTTPYLIFYYDDGKDKTANLPMWTQVIPEQQQFFYKVAGGEAAGKEAFGLFFNGFYLPHELGHAFEQLAGVSNGTSYAGEYFANRIAMAWWRKHGRQKELQSCYEAAKIMWAKLPNPVPQGMNAAEYFTKNYEEASRDPFIYGYMQFKQFIEIYEDQTLPQFDELVRQTLAQKK